MARHADEMAVAENLPRESHEYAARLEVAIRAMIEDGGYDGFSFHFDAFGNDGRFRQLPLLAASDLMADGYGFAAEGDTNTTTLMCAAQAMIGDAHFSEMYAMDWELDSVLISHMGEGNWKIARQDRPVKLIDRPLGIGRLDNPPTPVFSAEPGIATTAALVPIEGEIYRLVVGRGEVLDTPELPEGRDALLPLPSGAGDGERSWMTGSGSERRTISCSTSATTSAAGGGSPSCSTSSTRRSEAARARRPASGRCSPRTWAARIRARDADVGQRVRASTERPG